MLLPKFSRLKLLKDPRDGIEPFSKLLERSISWSFDMLPSEAGTIPLNLLPLMINDMRFGSEWAVFRSICPSSELLPKLRYLSDDTLYIAAGTFPDTCYHVDLECSSLGYGPRLLESILTRHSLLAGWYLRMKYFPKMVVSFQKYYF